MSIVWFAILMCAWRAGIEIDEASWMMIAIFYVGDCILLQRKGD
nr:MAG TPA: hypothetical protein [Caudoviricetes sp.]